jgi:hypothetical protein
MYHSSKLRPVCTVDQYCRNWLLISSEQWTAQTTNLLGSYLRRICACIRWRTQTALGSQFLIQTDSLGQPRKVLCFKIFSMYSQCKVFLHPIYIHKYPWTKCSTMSKIIPAQKVTANLVVLNLVVKMHNVRSRNYYKVGFNFSLEIIRMKLAKFRLNTPIGLTPVGWFPNWSSIRLYRVSVVANCAISPPN